MSGEAKHTPGPWTVVLRGERGTFHIPESKKHESGNSDDGVDGYTVSKANARLIAAAPDLLSVAQGVAQMQLIDAEDIDGRVVYRFSMPGKQVFNPPAFVAAARAALSKAQGDAT